jgi:glutamyl-tRNA synthetase
VPDDPAREALGKPDAQACLSALQFLLPDSETLATAVAQELLAAAAATAGVKKGVVMKSLRAALLGSLQGPDLLASWQLLHQNAEDGKRLAQALGQS